MTTRVLLALSKTATSWSASPLVDLEDPVEVDALDAFRLDGPAHLLGVLSRLGPEHSGRFFDWKGEEFPP